MTLTLVINVAIIAFCLWMSKGNIRIFVVYAAIFVSVNSLALFHHVLPISAALVKSLLLLGMLLFSITWATFTSTPGQVQHIWRQYFSVLALMFLFLIAMLIGVSYSSEQAYGFNKTRAFAIFAVVPSVIFILLAPYTRHQLATMGAIVILSSLVVAAGLVVSAQGVLGARATLDEAINVNNVARNLGTGLLVGLMVLIFQARSLSKGVLLLVSFSALVLFIAILFTGARGPLLSVGATVTLMLFITIGLRRIGDVYRAGVVVTAAVVLTGIVVTAAFGQQLKRIDFQQAQRVVELTQRIGDNRSDQQRLERYRVAADGFQASPAIGIGTGGFYRLWQGPPLPISSGITERDYPHNIFLEAAVELGLLGLLVLLGLMTLLVRKLLQFAWTTYGAPDANVAIFLGLWIYGLLNAQVSGDIGTNYLVWLGMTLTFMSLARSSTVLIPAGSNHLGEAIPRKRTWLRSGRRFH